MYQIKTVIKPAVFSDVFDQAVNDLLADGWTLGMRDLVYPSAPVSCPDKFFGSVLYAELYKGRPVVPDFPPNPDDVPEI